MSRNNNYIGYNDAPVETRREDAFNVGQYVDGIAEFIRTCATPMTISIQGDWGSGKTSIMNMINRALVPESAEPANIRDLSNDKFHTIWFNTWQYSQFNSGETLAISMITHLLKKMNPTNACMDVIKHLWTFVKASAAYMSDITLSERITDSVQQSGQFLFDSGDSSDQFQELKDTFSKSVEKLGKRVVIFIDDLDRLRPEKAVELLEVLKLFLDCNNCIFVLAIDYEVVTSGISAKYGDNVGKEKGRSFFDKIIQLPFKVPVSNYDINTFVKSTLKEMNIITSRPECYVDLIRLSIGYNPRAMKRLFNSFKLLDIIMYSDRNDNVFINDDERQRYLFSTISMQMGFEVLYQFIASVITATGRDNSATARIITSLTDRDNILNTPELSPLVEVLNNDAEKNLDHELDRVSQFMVYFFAAIQEERTPDINIIMPDSVGSSPESDNADIVNSKLFHRNIHNSVNSSDNTDYDAKKHASSTEHTDSFETRPERASAATVDNTESNIKIKVKNENQLDIAIGEAEIRKLRACFKRSAITAVTSETNQTDNPLTEWQHNKHLASRAINALNTMRIGGSKRKYVQYPDESRQFSPQYTRISGFTPLRTSGGLTYTLGFMINSTVGDIRYCYISMMIQRAKNTSLTREIYDAEINRILSHPRAIAENATVTPAESKVEILLPVDISDLSDDGIINLIIKSVSECTEDFIQL